MKTLFRCVDCKKYSLQKVNCPHCGGKTKNPYPARFSIEKEKRYRKFIKQLESNSN